MTQIRKVQCSASIKKEDTTNTGVHGQLDHKEGAVVGMRDMVHVHGHGHGQGCGSWLKDMEWSLVAC